MKTLVLGVGNVLMGDEGVGVHVVARLRERAEVLQLDPAVDIVDGGTGGFHLLEFFERYEQIVLIDAALDEKPPGTVSVLRPRYSKDYPRTLSAHDIGLKDLVDTAAVLGFAPEVILVTVSINEATLEMGTELTQVTQAAVDEAARRVVDLLRAPPSVP